jgi:hypothetical protein
MHVFIERLVRTNQRKVNRDHCFQVADDDAVVVFFISIDSIADIETTDKKEITFNDGT